MNGAVDAHRASDARLGHRSARVVSTGVGHLLVPLVDRSAVDRAAPDAKRFTAVLEEGGGQGCCLNSLDPPEASGAIAYTTFFNPSMGISEDPATGSAAGPLAAPLLALGAGVGPAGGIIGAQAMNQIDTDRAGMAAGMLNTVRGSADALILALFGAALVPLLAITLGSLELAGRVVTGSIPDVERETSADRFTDAWCIGVLALATLFAVAAVATGVLVRPVTAAGSPSQPLRSRSTCRSQGT